MIIISGWCSTEGSAAGGSSLLQYPYYPYNWIVMRRRMKEEGGRKIQVYLLSI
jgi:hypothetical protein